MQTEDFWADMSPDEQNALILISGLKVYFNNPYEYTRNYALKVITDVLSESAASGSLDSVMREFVPMLKRDGHG